MRRIFIVACLLFISEVATGQKAIEIVHFDIGQGDATLIVSTLEDNSTITVLFDAGGYSRLSGEDAGAIINGYLMEEGIEQIDYLIISHYDADHIGGIVAGGHNNIYETSFAIGPDGQENTGDDIRVINVIDRGDDDPPKSTIFQEYLNFTGSSNRMSIDSRSKLNYKIRLGSDAEMTCIAANGFVINRSSAVQYTNTENERSLSFILRYRDFDYLISGDLIGRRYGAENARVEEAVGEYIRRENINIDVLHVNHHGANNTSDEAFLNYIEAEIAIISCGDGNSHGHPTLETMERLIGANVQQIFQTNLGSTVGEVPESVNTYRSVFDGHVVLKTDGSEYVIYKYGYPAHKGYYFSFTCDE